MIELQNPGKKVLRKMSYLKDQKGILNRYLRESDAWDEHLKRSREFILNDISKRKPENIFVLGSGWLLDFPLEEVLEIVSSAVLVDIVHPVQIKAKVAKSDKLEMLTGDLGGSLIMDVFRLVQESKKINTRPDLKTIQMKDLPVFPENSYLVSLNILCQLDILIVDYLKQYWKFEEGDLKDFRGRIQEAHIGLFKSYPGILITDFLEKNYSKKGDVIAEKKLVYAEFPPAVLKENWTWEFDTKGMYIDNLKVCLEISAMSF